MPQDSHHFYNWRLGLFIEQRPPLADMNDDLRHFELQRIEEESLAAEALDALTREAVRTTLHAPHRISAALWRRASALWPRGPGRPVTSTTGTPTG